MQHFIAETNLHATGLGKKLSEMNEQNCVDSSKENKNISIGLIHRHENGEFLNFSQS